MRLLRHNPLIKPTLKSVLLDKPLRELFKKRYKDNYNFIYQAEDEIEGYYDTCTLIWDNFYLKAQKDLQNDFSLIPDILGDMVLSDREIVAFMWTVREFGIYYWI